MERISLESGYLYTRDLYNEVGLYGVWDCFFVYIVLHIIVRLWQTPINASYLSEIS